MTKVYKNLEFWFDFYMQCCLCKKEKLNEIVRQFLKSTILVHFLQEVEQMWWTLCIEVNITTLHWELMTSKLHYSETRFIWLLKLRRYKQHSVIAITRLWWSIGSELVTLTCNENQLYGYSQEQFVTYEMKISYNNQFVTNNVFSIL